VDELIGPHTVNTVPPKTLEAFKDHGNPQLSIEADMAAAKKVLADLDSLGLSLDQATDELEVEGVAAFSKSIHELMGSIEEKQAKVAS
jgi:transaldolase